MSDTIKSVSVIGNGDFGTFVSTLVPTSATVKLISKERFEQAATSRQDELWDSTVLVLAVPLSAYQQVLAGLRDNLKAATLVIDVCSVKLRPSELINQFLPKHANLLLTHPLFGPQSAAAGTEGHRLVVTHSRGAMATRVLRFCADTLGLELVRMSAEDHDKAMAQVQGLTLFVARSLGNMDLPAPGIMTPSYQMLLDLVTFDATHSNDLFETVEAGNPFAKDLRRRLVESFEQTERQLEN